MKKYGLIFWFTGLSGSGKTTVAEGVKPLLEADGYSILILDGDDIRKRLHKHLGFSKKDIISNNALIAELCKKHRESYDVILVPIIAPFTSSRKKARASLGKGFYEIYFRADIKTVAKRDVKGLYSKAGRNEIRDLIGYSPGTVYQPPQKPDLALDSGTDSAEKSVSCFYNFVIDKLRGAICV